MLGANETQESSLALVFHYADAKGLPLLDLGDLRALLTFLDSDAGKPELEGIGGLSPATVGVLLRSLVGLETGGGTEFFGEPQLDVADLLRLAPDGRGVVSCVELAAVQEKPALWSTALMWLVAELFEALPEAGDLPKPKLVVFLDEAHLLFDDATDAFLDSLARTVRLIRSKGVGVFFVTQQPTDLSEEVLAQLGLRDPARAARVHAGRREEAARDRLDLPAVGPLRRRDAADLGRHRRGGGDAAVGEGRPDAGRAHAHARAVVEHGPGRRTSTRAAKASPLWAKYGERTDAQSAREILAGRLAAPEPAGPAGEPDLRAPMEHVPAPRSAPEPRRAPAPEGGGADAIGDFLQLARGQGAAEKVARGIFGMLRKRPLAGIGRGQRDRLVAARRLGRLRERGPAARAKLSSPLAFTPRLGDREQPVADDDRAADRRRPAARRPAWLIRPSSRDPARAVDAEARPRRVKPRLSIGSTASFVARPPQERVVVPLDRRARPARAEPRLLQPRRPREVGHVEQRELQALDAAVARSPPGRRRAAGRRRPGAGRPSSRGS